MTIDEILDAASAEAIACQLTPTQESMYRHVCRLYSKKFNTALPVVMDLDPYEVALAVFEENLSERRDEEDFIDSLLEMIYSMSDPNYDKEKEKELEDFMESVRKEASNSHPKTPNLPEFPSKSGKSGTSSHCLKKRSLPTHFLAQVRWIYLIFRMIRANVKILIID